MIVFFVLSQIKAQKSNQLIDCTISGIRSYIIEDKKLVREGYSLMDTSRYYICMDGLPANFPYDSVQNATFYSLNNIEGIPSFLERKLKKGIKTLFVNLKIENNKIVISVSGRGIKRLNKNDIRIVVGDWCVTIYEYSCAKHKWELKETKYDGI